MAKVKVPTADEITGMWQASGLKEKLIFTFLMITVFRFGTQIPIFGINPEFFTHMMNDPQHANNLMNFLDMFSGGAIAKVSILALGIGPYITSSIIMQLLTAVVPQLETLQKEEGEAGRRKISQYTRVFAVVLAVFQASIFTIYLTRMGGAIMPGLHPAFFFIEGVLTFTAGAIFVMWLAEIITERGIGNGASLLIFVGILSRIPYYAEMTGTLVASDSSKQIALVFLLAIFLATIVFIVIMQEAVRKVIIVNAKRQVGNKVYGGVSTHIPFKLNPGGVMPIIFAVAILLFPSTILNAIGNRMPAGFLGDVLDFLRNTLLNPGQIYYYIIYLFLIIALTFFYASIIPSLQPKEIANNLKKYGSSIPGIKPGKPTADVLDKILGRTTFIGAVGLGVIALIPGIATYITGITTLQGLGATSLIIMVGVALDFLNQIKTHLLARQYEGFLKQ